MVAALHLVPGGFQQPADAEGIFEIQYFPNEQVL